MTSRQKTAKGRKPPANTHQYQVNFLHRGKWWVAWCDDVPGALGQGRTLEAARENRRDAIRLMLEPVDLDALPEPTTSLVREVLER